MGIRYTIELSGTAKDHLQKLINEHKKRFGVAPKIGKYEQIEEFIEEIEDAIESGKPFVTDARIAEEAGHEILL